MKIDFVSDVACPWCAVGLNALEQALQRLGTEVPKVPITLNFQPFELNPQMSTEGEDAAVYLSRKYGMSAAQVAQAQARLHERGLSVGFEFGNRARVWNTFDAHRLLHWAGLHGGQRELKHALLAAYHRRGENPGSHEVLLRLVTELGLDAVRAAAILASDEYAKEVREREAHWQSLGISSVPSIIINDQHLIEGGQPPEVFEQALRQIAAQAAAL